MHMNDVDIKTREYTTVSEVAGPLMVVQDVEGVAYNEIVEIETPTGENRTGQVLEVENDVALVQVFEGTSNLNTLSRPKSLWLSGVLSCFRTPP